MGMLFNTDGTIEILSKLNDTFAHAGLARLKTDDGKRSKKWSKLFKKIGTGGNGTYTSVAKPLGVDLDSAATGGLKSQNWQTFLAYLDANSNNDGTGDNIATVIGKGISKAITQQQPPYVQIEFYAVPVKPPQGGPYVSAQITDYNDANGELSLIVTISTCTVDELPSQSLSSGRRRRKRNPGEDS